MRSQMTILGKEQSILSTTTVKELKQKICNKAGEADRIVFSTYELTDQQYDHKTLAEVGIGNHSMVTLVFRVRGGVW